MSKAHQYLCYAMLDGCEQYVQPIHVEFLRARGEHRFACFKCREQIAKQRKFTVACNNKQGYELITDLSHLKQLNPKRTI
jgi:hypothetical protein